VASSSEWVVDRTEAESAGGMVAAKTPQAATAGAEVLRRGGNAVDAAVVSALVSSVVEPWMNGIGGGGYLVRHDGRSAESSVIAFPMVSPRSAAPDMFPLSGRGVDSSLFAWPAVVDSANIVGHRAVCIPGTVDGLALAIEKYGTINFSQALEPAIELAEGGFPVTWHTTLEIARDLINLRRFRTTEQLLCAAGIPPWSISEESPAIFRQPELAATLIRLAKNGARTFYEGEIASKIVSHLNEGGGEFVLEDFSSYHASVEESLVATYSDCEVHTLNNGTGGPTVAESLSLLDGFDFTATGHNSIEALHLYAQAFAISFADRFAYLADPEHVEVPIPALLAGDYLDERCNSMSQETVGDVAAARPERIGVKHGLSTSVPNYTSDGSTTHLSVIDRDGVAVSLTQTLLSLWGSRVTVPETGIILNNGMMWFDPEPGRPNSVAGRKKPLSNMAPAILVRNGQAVASLGASGGRRIMNCVAQIAMNLVDHALGMQAAVSAPRIDRSTPALFTSSRLPGAVTAALGSMGHRVQMKHEGLLFGEFASPACVQFDGSTFKSGVDPYYFPATAVGV
jgi:gamma-glutamyltranspeptidase / glutathione hydrolase